MTKKLFVLASLVLAVAVILSACGTKPVASYEQAMVACGEAGVKSYSASGFECNSVVAPAATEAFVVATQAPTATPSNTPVPQAPSLSCLGSATIISQSSDWTVVVVETNGRIWNPCLLDGSIRPSFTVTFTAPATGTYTFNGVNASLQLNGTVIAENVNGKSVKLVQGKTYTVVNGPTNGGFELLPLSQ